MRDPGLQWRGAQGREEGGPPVRRLLGGWADLEGPCWPCEGFRLPPGGLGSCGGALGRCSGTGCTGDWAMSDPLTEDVGLQTVGEARPTPGLETHVGSVVPTGGAEAAQERGAG